MRPCAEVQPNREVPQISAYPLPDARFTSSNRVSWPIDAGRCALLVHDAQNYWIRRFAEPGPLLSNMMQLRAAAKRLGMPTIFTGSRKGDTRAMRGLAYDMWGPGMGRYSGSQDDDAQIIAEMAIEPGDLFIEKSRYSAFFQTDLEERLRNQGIDQIIICGVYCHHGCLLTAADAYMRDIKVFFAIDASADHNRQFHEMAISIMADLCARNMLTDQILDSLDQSRQTEG